MHSEQLDSLVCLHVPLIIALILKRKLRIHISHMEILWSSHQFLYRDYQVTATEAPLQDKLHFFKWEGPLVCVLKLVLYWE